MTSVSEWISAWGAASVVLLITGLGVGEYNLRVYDRTGRPWIAFYLANEICVVVLLAAVVCGVIAARRGSKWWAVAAFPALLFAIIYYLGDL